MAKISVLMNCLNGEKYIQTSVPSVLNQSYSDFEIIFVDNCSTDGTAEKIHSFKDSRIKYHKTPQTIPLYGGRKFALQFVDSEYTCFLDIDDFWDPKKLELQLELMKQTRSNMLYTNFKTHLMDFDPLRLLKAKLYYQLKYVRRSLIPSGYRDLKHMLTHYDVNLQTVMIDTKILKNLSFNSSLNLFGDADVFLRFAKLPEAKIFYSHIPTSYTSIHPGQLSRKSHRDWYNEISGLIEGQYQQIFSPKELNLFSHFLEMYKS